MPVGMFTLLVASSRYALMEPLFALTAAAIFVLLCVGLRRVQQEQPRSRRFWIVYVTLLAGSLVVAVALGHDWLDPSHDFRAIALRLAITTGVVALPVLLVVVLRENDRTGYLANEEYRGIHGRAVIPVFGAAWCFLLGFWILTLFPQAPDVLVFATFGAALVFGILLNTVELFVQPRFLVPRSLRDQPGRVENWLAGRERRTGGGRRRVRHRLSVPEGVTVALEKKRPAGWSAWSAELDDFSAAAGTIEDLIDLVSRKLQARFAHPGGANRALKVVYVVYGDKAETSLSRHVLFDVSRAADGEYSAQSAEDPTVRFSQRSLEELMRAVAASGISEATFTWSRSIEL